MAVFRTVLNVPLCAGVSDRRGAKHPSVPSRSRRTGVATGRSSRSNARSTKRRGGAERQLPPRCSKSASRPPTCSRCSTASPSGGSHRCARIVFLRQGAHPRRQLVRRLEPRMVSDCCGSFDAGRWPRCARLFAAAGWSTWPTCCRNQLSGLQGIVRRLSAHDLRRTTGARHRPHMKERAGRFADKSRAADLRPAAVIAVGQLFQRDERRWSSRLQPPKCG
jgi:hypothetical protein